MIFKDYYAILECNKNSSNEEIKKKYYTLALKYHPDKNPRDKIAEEKFKDINEAWSVLGNENKRQQYDEIYESKKKIVTVSKRKSRGVSTEVSQTQSNNKA